MENSVTRPDLSFGDQVFANLPQNLTLVISCFATPFERSLFLLSALCAIGSILPAFGYFDRKLVYPSLFGFAIAPSAGGKGGMRMARGLIDRFLKDKICHLLPTNISIAGLYEALNETGGEGLFIESEADSLHATLRSSVGELDALLRKAYDNEDFSKIRYRQDPIRIPNVRFSAMLSGTPDQLTRLIKNQQSGLLSRFCLLNADTHIEHRELFGTENLINDAISQAGDEIYRRITTIIPSRGQEVRFELTQEQATQFNTDHFNYQNKAVDVVGDEALPSARRLGVIRFRIAMILSAIRDDWCTNDAGILICSDAAFKASRAICDVLLQNAFVVLDLYATKNDRRRIPEFHVLQLLRQLPEEFTRKNFIAATAGVIPTRSADRYLVSMPHIIQPVAGKHGVYEKVGGVA